LTREQLDQPEPTFPLDLAFCPGCTLVQITESVPPETLFREYVYFSSYSDTMLAHARALVKRLAAARALTPSHLVIEIASNDGYLLQYYKERGIPVLGIEPARNVARLARVARGIETLDEFFDKALAHRLAAQGQRADVIHAHNVLAHVPDMNGFVEGLNILLQDQGVAVVEVPYVRDLVDHGEFDTIYHEHLSYFSMLALDALFSRQGLILADVERVPIHGGSLRLFVNRRANGEAHSAAVRALIDEERRLGLDGPDYYRAGARRLAALKEGITALVRDLKRQGKRLAVYGASAKGSTLLNYLGLGRAELDFVVDRSPVKKGRYAPGSHLPIYAPDRLLHERPDYVLLLTWNFADEILAQQQEYRRRGGRFIIPLPELKVV
jgi:hypothetical protein